MRRRSRCIERSWRLQRVQGVEYSDEHEQPGVGAEESREARGGGADSGASICLHTIGLSHPIAEALIMNHVHLAVAGSRRHNNC